MNYAAEVVPVLARRLLASGLAAILLWGLPPGEVRAQELTAEKNGFFSIAEDTIVNRTFARQSLLIRSAAALGGQLTIRTHRDTTLILRYTKRARAQNKRTAFEFISAISAKLDPGATESELQFRSPNPPPWRGANEVGTVDATILVPERTAIVVDAPLFDIDAAGPFQSFRVFSSLGRVVLAEVTEQTEITTANQRVTVTNLRGLVRLKTTNATLEAVGLHPATGSTAILQNDGGDIVVRNSDGSLDIKNAFGRIQLVAYDLGDASTTIHGQANPIQIECRQAGSGQLVVENQDEDIELSLPEKADVSLLLRVSERGEIEAADFRYQVESMERTRMALRLGRGASEMNATIKGQGNIYVRQANSREGLEEE